MNANSKAALLFAALALATFASLGGDKPRDRRLEPIKALPLTELCLRLRDGHWLRAVVVQENYRHFRWHECYYGLNAHLERRWLGLP